ncbi:putative NEMP family, major facilitator superfamily domain-containing protein [Lupinus albus]|uniref:Putative NEMP family, major facilitator superfamily domain-containing protein n=1 Tax=Lupinus albus TaxID=3870 RepID=A0A6A4PDC6_LUPAL|nr:putative NEMP family, major facilitator superfamily domain-containing protein [Lupinus albus]
MKLFFFFFSHTTITVLLLLLQFFFSSSNAINNDTPLLLKGVDIERPVLDVSPSVLSGHSATHGVKDTLRCERVQVSGISRLKLGSYSSSFHITLAPSAAIPERLHNKIQVCFHRNNSLGWCRCEKDEWRSVQKGVWSAIMSPYENRYVDVRINGDISDSVTVALEEDFQKWRLICLAMGSVFLLLAPIISSWVPFYYSSSMAIGIFLVIIILLFQGMKLLPTGRKSIFYITIYGSVLGVGSVILHQFSAFVNSILQSFGLSEEMHNPVAIFVLLGIILAGAALGYWIVRRFVISEEDGTVDTGVAQFVKWAMRIVGATFILQSTLDPLLAIGALVSCGAVCNLISLVKWLHGWYETSGRDDYSLQLVRRRTHGRAEFLGKSTPKGKMWNSPKQSSWSESPVRGVVSPSSGFTPVMRPSSGFTPVMRPSSGSGFTPVTRPSSGTQNGQDYYSTYHKTRNRKKFTKKEWDDFTRESTKQALAEWAASPEFSEWIIDNAERIELLPVESSDETMGSESDSTDVGSENGIWPFNLLRW